VNNINKDNLTMALVTDSSKLTFGPVPSRRFGISLGVDLSLNSKQCNFDCLYCELEASKPVSTMQEYPSVAQIIQAVQTAFKKHPNIDVITITANGEPTLYPYLKELIQALNSIKHNAKTLILSNGSLITQKEVFEALLEFDIVKLSLDCATQKCFEKLDRVQKALQIEPIIDSMIEFSKQTQHDVILEILFVHNMNDNDEEVHKLYESILKINPTRVDIGTIDRPPAYKVKPVDFDFLQSVAHHFKGINTNIVYKNRPKQIHSFTKKEILRLLQRRPLTHEDIENLFDKNSQKLLEELVEELKIKVINNSGVKFYKIS
jgi:wyosine [tRNA(Phe)-imidazoG37] synthetase (radical SAM superfamily)